MAIGKWCVVYPGEEQFFAAKFFEAIINVQLTVNLAYRRFSLRVECLVTFRLHLLISSAVHVSKQ